MGGAAPELLLLHGRSGGEYNRAILVSMVGLVVGLVAALLMMGLTYGYWRQRAVDDKAAYAWLNEGEGEE